MIAILDYGLGNVLAFVNVYNRLNISVKVAKSPVDLEGVTRIILPGVGSFDQAVRQFDESGLRPLVEEMVLRKSVPLLGICVGMQMLAGSSDEGKLPGLGWINGRVRRLKETNNKCNSVLPHMGWNDVKPVIRDDLFDGIDGSQRFYFLHSYCFECGDAMNILASTWYCEEFTCAVKKNNIYGVQFHPEKSHIYGARLLEQFAKI